MLTTIPWKEFLALTNGIKEDDNSSKKPFKWDEMLRYRETYKRINDYIATTNCKFIGKGSSRNVYFLPVGAYDTKYLNEPSCFKLANLATRGVAQNKAEIGILYKFSDKYACFPKLYDWDGDKFYFMLCEVGTPYKTVPKNEIVKYFSEWNQWIERKYSKYSLVMRIDDDKKSLCNFLKLLFADLRYDESVDKAEAKKAVVQELGEEVSKYKGIADFLTFILDKGGKDEVLPVDFFFEDNWALVYRNSELVMLPIDWGFTSEVSERFY